MRASKKYIHYSDREYMNEKYKITRALMIALIVVILVFSSTFALSYSAMNSEINAKNQKITDLIKEIQSKDSTISMQNNSIANLKLNDTNLTLIVALIKEELNSTNGNYTNLSILFSVVKQIYGINVQLLQRLRTTVLPQEYQLFRQGNSSSNRTWFLVLSSVPNNGFVQGNSTNNLDNYSYFINTSYSSSGLTEALAVVTLPNFVLYFHNTGNVSAVFNYTLFEIWRS